MIMKVKRLPAASHPLMYSVLWISVTNFLSLLSLIARADQLHVLSGCCILPCSITFSSLQHKLLLHFRPRNLCAHCTSAGWWKASFKFRSIEQKPTQNFRISAWLLCKINHSCFNMFFFNVLFTKLCNHVLYCTYGLTCSFQVVCSILLKGQLREVIITLPHI